MEKASPLSAAAGLYDLVPSDLRPLHGACVPEPIPSGCSKSTCSDPSPFAISRGKDWWANRFMPGRRASIRAGTPYVRLEFAVL